MPRATSSDGRLPIYFRHIEHMPHARTRLAYEIASRAVRSRCGWVTVAVADGGWRWATDGQINCSGSENFPILQLITTLIILSISNQIGIKRNSITPYSIPSSESTEKCRIDV